jgi:hypothetical protein
MYGCLQKIPTASVKKSYSKRGIFKIFSNKLNLHRPCRSMDRAYKRLQTALKNSITELQAFVCLLK